VSARPSAPARPYSNFELRVALQANLQKDQSHRQRGAKTWLCRVLMKGQLDGCHDVVDVASYAVQFAQIVYLSKRT
jgi:hypothetical protein